MLGGNWVNYTNSNLEKDSKDPAGKLYKAATQITCGHRPTRPATPRSRTHLGCRTPLQSHIRWSVSVSTHVQKKTPLPTTKRDPLIAWPTHGATEIAHLPRARFHQNAAADSTQLIEIGGGYSGGGGICTKNTLGTSCHQGSAKRCPWEGPR